MNAPSPAVGAFRMVRLQSPRGAILFSLPLLLSTPLLTAGGPRHVAATTYFNPGVVGQPIHRAAGQSSAASWGPGSAQRHRHQPAASLSERGVGRRAAPHCTITGAKTSDPLFCWTATSQEGLTSQEGSTSLRQARREAKTSSMRAGDATASHVPFADIVPSRLSGRAHERVEVR